MCDERRRRQHEGIIAVTVAVKLTKPSSVWDDDEDEDGISFDCTLRRRDTKKSVCILIPVFVHFYTFDEVLFISIFVRQKSFASKCQRERDLSEEKRAPHFYSFLPERTRKKKDTDIKYVHK